MRQVFGDFVEQESGDEYLLIHFLPTSLPIQQRWRNSGLSADFLAVYWATFFPAHDVSSQKRQREIKGTINYIASELLENVMKYSYQPAGYPVDLGLYLYENEFRFYTNNAVDPQAVLDFQARIQALLTEDTQMLYLKQLERNAADERCTDSGLGLLTMINDYEVRMAWKFETFSRESDVIIITTMVQLAL